MQEKYWSRCFWPSMWIKVPTVQSAHSAQEVKEFLLVRTIWYCIDYTTTSLYEPCHIHHQVGPLVQVTYSTPDHVYTTFIYYQKTLEVFEKNRT